MFERHWVNDMHLDHVAGGVVEDQEPLLPLLLGDHEEVGEEEEGEALLVDPPPECELLAVLLPGESGAVSAPDQPPGGGDQGDGADVPETRE